MATNMNKKKMTPEERRAINSTIVPQNRTMKAFIEHQHEYWVDPRLLESDGAGWFSYIKLDTNATKHTSNSKNMKKKITPEERRAINSTIVPQNRSMKAFIEHKGEVWVKDPNLL